MENHRFQTTGTALLGPQPTEVNVGLGTSLGIVYTRQEDATILGDTERTPSKNGQGQSQPSRPPRVTQLLSGVLKADASLWS